MVFEGFRVSSRSETYSAVQMVFLALNLLQKDTLTLLVQVSKTGALSRAGVHVRLPCSAGPKYRDHGMGTMADRLYNRA